MPIRKINRLSPFPRCIYFLAFGLLLVWMNMISVVYLARAEKIETLIKLREEYTDNLYLEKEKPKDDFQTTLEIGLKSFPISGQKRFEEENRGMGWEYKGKLIRYYDFPQEDHEEHDGHINIKFGFWEKDTFAIGLGKKVLYAQRDARGVEGLGNLVQTDSLTLAPSFSLSIPRGKLALGYEYNQAKYEGSEFVDNQSWKGSFQMEKEMGLGLSSTIGYSYQDRQYSEEKGKDPKYTDNYEWKGYWHLGKEIGSRSSVSFGYSYLSRNYEQKMLDAKILDYHDQAGEIGLKLKMPLDVSGQIKYGHIWREDELGRQDEYYLLEGEVERSLGQKLQAKLSYRSSEYEEVGEHLYGNEGKYHSWAGEIKAILREGHFATVNYGQGYHQDLYGVIYKRNESKIEMNHNFKGRIKLAYSGYSTGDTFHEGGRKDITQGGRVSLTIFSPKGNSLFLAGDYEGKTFEPDEMHDQYLKGAVGLNYRYTAHLSSSLTYTYIDNTSNYSKREYTNNIISFEIKTAF